VCDAYNYRVQVFGLDGSFQHMWGSRGADEGKFADLHDVVVQGELLYVSDTFNHRVQVFEKATGTFVKGVFAGQFQHPGGMALTEEGQLCVCDGILAPRNGRMQVFE
jgi:DNA-binding beta-propeller fold protein YncE